MSNQYSKDQDEATVIGFEVPRSPDSSYNNPYPGSEDDPRDPPVIPPQLHRSLLSYPSSLNASGSIPLPENVILNHLYIENRQAPRSVVALGFTVFVQSMLPSCYTNQFREGEVSVHKT